MRVKCQRLPRQTPSERAALRAEFVRNRLGCSRAVEVNARPPLELPAPFEKLCIAPVARDAERLPKVGICILNLMAPR